jgi:hypothetical protein
VESSKTDLTTGVWYFVVVWHDSVADTDNIQVNNGTVDSISSAGHTPNNGAADFCLGARTYPSFEGYFNGQLSSVSFWKRTLTTNERTELYNGGTGLAYPFTSAVTPHATGLLAHYTLDSVLTDSSGNNYTLTNTGSVPFATGKLGNGANFTGADQYLMYDGIYSAGAVTLACWVKFNAIGLCYVAGKGAFGSDQDGDIQIGAWSSTELWAHVGTSGGVSSGFNLYDWSATTTGVWHHLAAVYNPATTSIKLYMDAVQLTTAPATGTRSSGDNPFHIGRMANHTGVRLNAVVDEVTLWERALSTNDIAALYAGGTGLFYPWSSSSPGAARYFLTGI